jgi:hypothetical protein
MQRQFRKHFSKQCRKTRILHYYAVYPCIKGLSGISQGPGDLVVAKQRIQGQIDAYSPGMSISQTFPEFRHVKIACLHPGIEKFPAKVNCVRAVFCCCVQRLHAARRSQQFDCFFHVRSILRISIRYGNTGFWKTRPHKKRPAGMPCKAAVILISIDIITSFPSRIKYISKKARAKLQVCQQPAADS